MENDKFATRGQMAALMRYMADGDLSQARAQDLISQCETRKKARQQDPDFKRYASFENGETAYFSFIRPFITQTPELERLDSDTRNMIRLGFFWSKVKTVECVHRNSKPKTIFPLFRDLDDTFRPLLRKTLEARYGESSGSAELSSFYSLFDSDPVSLQHWAMYMMAVGDKNLKRTFISTVKYSFCCSAVDCRIDNGFTYLRDLWLNGIFPLGYDLDSGRTLYVLTKE